MEDRFNGLIYGLGESPNEDIYIEEYRNLAMEYSNSTGKLTNLNLIGNHAASIGNTQFNDMVSTASTTISASSSLHSLNGSYKVQAAPTSTAQVINQQHYLLMQ
jgi:hypothetical protein